MNTRAIFNNRLITVSNRLPIVMSRDDNDEWHLEQGSGGLVTALAPVLRNRGGIWIGWPGTVEEQCQPVKIARLLRNATKGAGYSLKDVILSSEELEKYYKGFANEIIWPLFHDLQGFCNFNPEYWHIYQQVNTKFAQVIARNCKPSDFIWVHDYHLMGVAKALRDMGVKAKIGFFLHIPFPPLDIFVRLPWRFQLLHALLAYDLVGFQTLRDRRNFLTCLQTLLNAHKIQGKGQVATVSANGREVRIGAFPISIDYEDFAHFAGTQEVSDAAWYLHEDLPNTQIVLGIDRLDYSKGIPERLKAFQNALVRFPELREKVTLVQVVVPSRRDIPKYSDLKKEIERLVGKINGQFTASGWVPIHYIFRSLGRTELVAYYRTSEIALITPIKDGMNLISKEYCACNIEENGVLILSEFAGAAAQMQRDALLVNPHDIEGVADALRYALYMDREERRTRMHKLRQSVRKFNIFWWVGRFLEAAFAKNLDSFPVIEDYIPADDGEEALAGTEARGLGMQASGDRGEDVQ